MSSEPPTQEVPPPRHGGGGGVGAGKHKSKAYNSTLAIRSDAVKYRAKYKDLKKKVLEVEAENDVMHAKTLQTKRNIQRMRLERALLYEKMEYEAYVLNQLSTTYDHQSCPSTSAQAGEVTGTHDQDEALVDRPTRGQPSQWAYPAPSSSSPQKEYDSADVHDEQVLPSSPYPQDGNGYSSRGEQDELPMRGLEAHPLPHRSMQDYSSSEEGLP